MGRDQISGSHRAGSEARTSAGRAGADVYLQLADEVRRKRKGE